MDSFKPTAESLFRQLNRMVPEVDVPAPMDDDDDDDNDGGDDNNGSGGAAAVPPTQPTYQQRQTLRTSRQAADMNQRILAMQQLAANQMTYLRMRTMQAAYPSLMPTMMAQSLRLPASAPAPMAGGMYIRTAPPAPAPAQAPAPRKRAPRSRHRGPDKKAKRNARRCMDCVNSGVPSRVLNAAECPGAPANRRCPHT